MQAKSVKKSKMSVKIDKIMKLNNSNPDQRSKRKVCCYVGWNLS